MADSIDHPGWRALVDSRSSHLRARRRGRLGPALTLAALLGLGACSSSSDDTGPTMEPVDLELVAPLRTVVHNQGIQPIGAAPTTTLGLFERGRRPHAAAGCWRRWAGRRRAARALRSRGSVLDAALNGGARPERHDQPERLRHHAARHGHRSDRDPGGQPVRRSDEPGAFGGRSPSTSTWTRSSRSCGP